MLEHQKKVLQNVANNEELFKKELYKSLAWLNTHDLALLKVWLRNNYWGTYSTLIKEVMYSFKVSA
jgi:hypothetical protein